MENGQGLYLQVQNFYTQALCSCVVQDEAPEHLQLSDLASTSHFF